ncbi:MAG: zf-HC2 domain-containing protein, partial [Myxococcota bacterium]
MNHRRARRQLNDYLDGDLELEDRERLEEHLSGCDDCAREARELRQTVFLLRDLPAEAGPPGIAEAVMARVHAGHARPTR